MLQVSDVMYSDKWQPKKAKQLKRYQKTKLGRTKDWTKEGTPVNGWGVFLSLPTGSVKFLSFRCEVRLS